jgi:hypothetical protein
MCRFKTFEDRFNYLREILRKAPIGYETFGILRQLNQALYGGSEWKRFRGHILTRDNGCDLACPDREIPDGMPITVHHITPITPEDVEARNLYLVMDPENCVTMSQHWHRLLHFGGEDPIAESEPVIRRPNDTCPWRN